MEVGRMLKQLHGVFERAFNTTLQQYDLTMAQIDILRCLHDMALRGEPVNQRSIEAALRLKNPTVTGTLNRLEAKGLIVRRPDPRDGRSKLIEPTALEVSFRNEIRRTHRAHEARLMRGFTDAEVQTLKDLLGRALNNMTEDEDRT